jgi:hypothetical protein
MRDWSRSRRWLAPAAVGLVAVALSASFLARPRRLDPAGIRSALLEELQPVALDNCALARFGGPGDGGYLMCGNLLAQAEGAYSYGIGGTDDWGCEIGSRLGLPVHQYDCFNLAQPVCNDGGRFVFHAECIGADTAVIESRPFDTLARQILANGHGGKRLVVKMDVEGAEWDSLSAAADHVLEQIDQLALEFHGVDDARYPAVLQKLKRTFYLAHRHFNNMACQDGIAPFPAFAFQVLLVNKRIGVLDRSGASPALPHFLDRPDYPERPDCQALAGG